MHFRHHKKLLIILILVELWLSVATDVEAEYNLHLIMGAVYFGVSFWFVFGDRKWWLYQFAGVGYVAYIILNRILFIFQAPLTRGDYHLLLALFWAVILAIHLFVEKHIGPPMAKPSQRKPEQYFPDDDD